MSQAHPYEDDMSRKQAGVKAAKIARVDLFDRPIARS